MSDYYGWGGLVITILIILILLKVLGVI